MSTSPSAKRSPSASFAALPGPPRRPSTHSRHPSMSNRSSSQSLHYSIGALLGEPRRPFVEMLQDLPVTPTGDGDADESPPNESALELELDHTGGLSLTGLPSSEHLTSPPNVYVSLPSTPLQSPRPTSKLLPPDPVVATGRYNSTPDLHFRKTPKQSPDRPSQSRKVSQKERLFSIWDYLKSELVETEAEYHQEVRWERLENFLSVPLAVEKVRQCVFRAPYGELTMA